jgi:hypothetical protein
MLGYMTVLVSYVYLWIEYNGSVIDIYGYTLDSIGRNKEREECV